ncbi:MAG TPA: 30S ribosomal protein S16 [Ignavibacteriaceae bacterium]|nr:30S ribosomal protein S16 [Ignavibacteriaceae bacterium]
MAVKLRLRRMGKKKQPIYKIVAADSRSPRDGKFLESIGLYNPLTNPHTLNVNEDRALYWLNSGAQPTDTVRSLLRQKGITLKRDLIRKGLSEDKIQSELEQWTKMQEAKQTRRNQGKKTTEKKNETSEEANTAKSVGENITPEKNTEQVVESEKSTAEVKGATSEENTKEKE